MNDAMKRQQAKMKSAWSSVKRQGLKGIAARQAVAKLLKGGTTAPKTSLTPHAPKKRGPGRPKGRRDSKPRSRRRIPGSRRHTRAARRAAKAGPYIQLPFGMGAVDIAAGAYRDPGQTVQRTFTSVADLASLSARIATSQQGIRPTFRDPMRVRLSLAAGVM